jgi:lipopolysaccharide export system protein LptA
MRAEAPSQAVNVMSFAGRSFLVLPLLLLAAPCALLGQTPALQKAVVENPQYPEFYDPPWQSQLRSLVQGARAETLASNQVLISQAKVQNYRTNGEAEFVGEAPQCTYDRDAHSVSSPGTIRLQTGDGKLVIQGTGFRWIQTNGMLFISNAVHTDLSAGLWQSRPGQGGTQGATPNLGDLKIYSEHFFFDRTNNLAVYDGNATVTGTNLSLKGQTITIQTPSADQPFQELTVQENVVVDYEKMHVTGERATFSGQTGIARVTGNPRWQFDQREGSGDELVLDRTMNVFRVNGHAFLKTPIQTTGGTEFFPSEIASLHTNSAAPVTNRFLQVNCDHYEFQTNRAGFGDKVRALEIADSQTRGTMSCLSLELTFAGTNDLKSMIANRDVVFDQEENRLTGDRALYDGLTGNLEVSGNPEWRSGARGGHGDLIVINSRFKQMNVFTNAAMHLPANELGQATVLESTGKQVAAGRPALSGALATNQFADVFASQYTLRPESARFEQHVRLIHPRMNWTCDKVNVDTLSGPGTNVSILAQGSVVFVFTAEKQPPVHGTCDRAEYVFNQSVSPPMDRIEFTGNPVLENTNVTVHNSIIILDQTSKEFAVPGRYVIEGIVPKQAATASAFGTNTQRSVIR